MASIMLPQVKDVFLVNEAHKVEQEGYLAADSGERVEVLYVGEKHDDLGWVYCRILHGCEGRSDICPTGWIFRNFLGNQPEPHPELEPACTVKQWAKPNSKETADTSHSWIIHTFPNGRHIYCREASDSEEITRDVLDCNPHHKPLPEGDQEKRSGSKTSSSSSQMFTMEPITSRQCFADLNGISKGARVSAIHAMPEGRVVDRKAYTDETGYLAADMGAVVKVLYVGDRSKDDEEWVYAESEELPVIQGWLRMDVLTLRRQHIVQLDLPCWTLRQGNDIFTPLLAGMISRLADGEVVHELLRKYGPIDANRSGLWSQVERKNKARGWIETRLLRPNAENPKNYHAQLKHCTMISSMESVKKPAPPVSANNAMPSRQASPVPCPALSRPTPGGTHARLSVCSRDRRIIRNAVVASFGIEKIEGLWPRSRAQMHNLLRKKLNGWCHVVYDARCFSDPYRGSNRGHTGQHAEIICGVCNSPHFRDWLIRLKHKVAQEVAQIGTNKILRIAFYCKSGRHRSVAATYILQHILENQGFRVQVCHLSENSWGRHMCMGTCAYCKTHKDRLLQQKESALAAAVAEWCQC